MAIHETAIIDPDAEIGVDVEIGPYTVIGPAVRIGDRSRLGAHVVIERGTTLGAECQVASGAILGGAPQDTKYQGEETFLLIGERNIIREGVTIHRATGEGNATIVGNENMIMAYAHVGHNARLGNNITIASYVGISGHATVEDRVVFGGFVGVHQFVRIGKMTMIGGMSRVVQDVPPFMLVQGEQLQPHGLNVVGLRRAGVTAEVREQLKEAYRLLYRAGLNLQQAVERIQAEVPPSEERDYLVSFLLAVPTGRHGRQLDMPK
ncbi:MAG TPA: acyl-ACP--UDP-N-acetylglucosamine O-acyltransferase [Armatimonadota bacterium]|nr:acyl-ACP--UDP-N-acetylglucosamine O-acyltransferase [Armatimonadota bacterium]HPO74897.1 acyl-ACP--UDP-N-acetylglucosamine O-acyltransferase [Armatimonadota bacterium]